MFGRIGYRGYTVQDLTEDGNGAITLSPSNMVDGRMNYSNVSYLSWYKYHESPEIKIQQGDILYVKTGSTFGKTSYVDKLPMEATINPQILRIVPSIHPKYLAYCMSTPYSQALTDCYVVGSTIPTISQESIGNFSFAIPPLAEQEAIAAWLDEKCGETDAAIAKVDRELELIDELKQSEISRVVTRGLDPTAPLRPSGIDWIGEIPEHWRICLVKHKYSIQTGFTPATKIKEYYDAENGFIWITIGDMKDNVISDSVNKVSSKYIEEFKPQKTPKGSLLYSFKLSVGQVAFAGVDLYTNEAIASFLQSKSVNLNFLKYSSSLIINNANINIYGAPIMNQELIKNAPIVFPPLKEQEEIAAYLDKKCADIDGLKAKLVKKRATLKELRQAIISEVVTGKRKVI